MALSDIFDYFLNYDETSFETATCQGNEPTEADVTAFEATVGFRLPAEFREFTMSPLGGLYIAVREELWPRPGPFQVGPFWSFLYGIKVFGIATEIPEWLDIRRQYQEFRTAGFGNLVPFLQLECDADSYCFDSVGRIVKWNHEQSDNPEPQGMGFSDLLLFEIHELERRKDRKVCGEDRLPS